MFYRLLYDTIVEFFSKQTTTQREPEQQAIATSYNHSYNHRYNHRGKHLEVRRNEHGRL
jgi:hypothetical protein